MKTLESQQQNKPKKKVALGAAGLSLFFHGTLFLLIGSVVVVEYAVPRSPMTGEVNPSVSEEPAAPEEAPEAMGEPEAPDTPSEAAAAPAPTAPDLTVSSVNVLTVNSSMSSFQMPVTTGGSGGTGTGSDAAGTAGAGAKTGKPGKISNPFGGAERLGNASLEGTLYDLKQTKTGKSSGMNVAKYGDVLVDFFKNWNRKILEEYYQTKTPLYTTQIYMPVMGAGAAPAAFHVEKEVQPAQWVIVYQGSFQVPEGGSYRFAGYADDILAVRVNGKTVLDGSRSSMIPNQDHPLAKVAGQTVEVKHVVGNGFLAYSAWQRYEPGENNNIEILVGERPGGQFCAFLFVEQKSATYKKEASGRPVLPLFRTADMETTPASGADFQKDGPVFGSK